VKLKLCGAQATIRAAAALRVGPKQGPCSHESTPPVPGSASAFGTPSMCFMMAAEVQTAPVKTRSHSDAFRHGLSWAESVHVHPQRAVVSTDVGARRSGDLSLQSPLLDSWCSLRGRRPWCSHHDWHRDEAILHLDALRARIARVSHQPHPIRHRSYRRKGDQAEPESPVTGKGGGCGHKDVC